MDFIFDEEIQEVLKYECNWIPEFKKKLQLKKQRKEKEKEVEKVQEKLSKLDVNASSPKQEQEVIYLCSIFTPEPSQPIDKSNLNPASLVDLAITSSLFMYSLLILQNLRVPRITILNNMRSKKWKRNLFHSQQNTKNYY